MPNRLTDPLDFQAQALTLRSERQRLIASNIANADTPGYTARDMAFADALRAAAGTVAPGSGVGPGGASPRLLKVSQPGHFAQGTADSGSGALLYASPSQTNLDRNSVDMDRERASFADNTVKYEAALRFINGNVRTMLGAITGQ